jgi:hypothetical protein
VYVRRNKMLYEISKELNKDNHFLFAMERLYTKKKCKMYRSVAAYVGRYLRIEKPSGTMEEIVESIKNKVSTAYVNMKGI